MDQTMNIDPSRVAIRFQSVGFAYADAVILADASFHLHEGEFAVLVGPNGSGKTTVLRLLLGLLRPDAGRIEVLGGSPESARASLGYVPQHAGYDPAFPISVEEVVRMGRLRPSSRRFGADDERAVRFALERADVADLAARSYSALSGGQRRRVLVARALATEPRLLVLDEPTANMDVESEGRLFKSLGELKGLATILVVTHDTGFVSSLTDAVFCVGGREIANGGRGIARHRAVADDHAPPALYGGEARKVLHDVTVGDDECCGGHEK